MTKACAVLVVDDNQINRLVAGHILHGLGATVQYAEGGDEALHRLAAGESFDLIFLDVNMPDLGGFEVARQIRQWEQEDGRSYMPIVLHTAELASDIATQCRDAHIQGVLTKPISVDSVARMLKTHCDFEPLDEDGRPWMVGG